jgi:hypothetical protein
LRGKWRFGGAVSTWARPHLRVGWHNGDLVTYDQTAWGNGGIANGLIANGFAVYVSTGFTLGTTISGASSLYSAAQMDEVAAGLSGAFYAGAVAPWAQDHLFVHDHRHDLSPGPRLLEEQSGAWPVTSLTLGSQTYSQAQLPQILNTPVGTGTKADASLILADQLIAAKLSLAHGSDPTPIVAPVADADLVLSGFSGALPYQVNPPSPIGQTTVNLASLLAAYNQGQLTPGCTP